jgi:hypothetical protein
MPTFIFSSDCYTPLISSGCDLFCARLGRSEKSGSHAYILRGDLRKHSATPASGVVKTGGHCVRTGRVLPVLAVNAYRARCVRPLSYSVSTDSWVPGHLGSSPPCHSDGVLHCIHALGPHTYILRSYSRLYTHSRRILCPYVRPAWCPLDVYTLIIVYLYGLLIHRTAF